MKRRISTGSHDQDDLWNWADRQPRSEAEASSDTQQQPSSTVPGHRDGLIRRLLNGISQRTSRSL